MIYKVLQYETIKKAKEERCWIDYFPSNEGPTQIMLFQYYIDIKNLVGYWPEHLLFRWTILYLSIYYAEYRGVRL